MITHTNIRYTQARTGPAGYREIPGGPVGRWAGGPVGRWAGGPVGRWAGGHGGPVGRLAGGQQKDYDILFLLAIDVINYDIKQNCLSRVIMAKRHRQKSLNTKL